MKAGRFEVKVINAGFLAMDCGGIFGIIPKAIWQKKVTPDEHNRLKMSTNCLLLISDDRKILVDTGVGNGLGDKLRKIYNIQDETNIESSLAENGLTPKDITDVIVTHLHFDHAGGLMDHKTKEPFFSNARYYSSEEQFHWANNPTMIDRASYKKRNYNPVYDAGRMQLLKNGEQPMDGMKFYYTKGHTPGLICLEIEDENQPVYYCTDIFPTSHHVPVHYISAYDLHPLELLKEKRFFLKKLWENNGVLVFPHDTKTTAASVEINNDEIQIHRTFKII
ncbi:MBL fold metallo-hydrolase [Methanococcoides sp. SA1]|nr:MBL fold metallo-hydrolase [Methanococcoides sp. SA1]